MPRLPNATSTTLIGLRAAHAFRSPSRDNHHLGPGCHQPTARMCYCRTLLVLLLRQCHSFFRRAGVRGRSVEVDAVVGRHRRHIRKACIRDVVLTNAPPASRNRTPPTRCRRRCPTANAGPTTAACAGPTRARYVRRRRRQPALAVSAVSKLPSFRFIQNGNRVHLSGRPDESPRLGPERSPPLV